MLIKIFGCKIHISLFFIAMIALILFFDKSGIMLLGLSSVLIHEIGHFAFMVLLKQIPSKVIIQPAGIIIKRNNCLYSYSDELLVAMGGCLFNLVAAVAACLISNSAISILFSLTNASIGLFNLIPISGLDGNDILRFILIKKFNDSLVNKICKIVSFISVFGLIAVVILSFFIGNGNVSLLIVTTYLAILLVINIRS